MKVALLTDGIFPFEIGGMQKHAHHLAKEFLKKGVDLTIYHCIVDREIPEDVDQELRKSLNAEDTDMLKSFCFKFPRLKVPIFGHYVLESYLYSKLIYTELIKEDSFDFIFAKGFSGWYSLKNKKKLAKIGVQFHGLEMFQPASSLKNHLEKIILRRPVKANLKRADAVFSYGGKIKQILLDLGINPAKIHLQYGGINKLNLVKEENIKSIEKEVKFLFIGRNERRKGYPELKMVLNGLQKDADFKFSFIGHIEEREKLSDKRLKYYGEIKDSKTYFDIIDAHDVLVVPSISEGLPTVILEAMSRGLTIIATDVGAIEDLVNDKNGFLIQPKSIEQLSNAILDTIKMNRKELRMKQINALKFVSENFDWNKLADKLIESIKIELKK
jgi:glycosyltransferase involved in cell wall biosynthesis